jgi:peptidoglycan/xylan/chitin deacetylase (PgdA/CDA1 family)
VTFSGNRRTLLRLASAALFSIAPAAAHAQQIAFTFDDLPAHSSLPPGETRLEVGNKVIAALQQAHLPPVYGFVNAVRMQEQPDTVQVLEAWRAAGFPLGNHTWSHMNLNEHTAAEWEADTLRGEPALEQQMPHGDWHWLRFPYLAEGNTPAKQAEIRAFLLQHGYKIAGVTMSFADYSFNDPYARCMAKGDTAAVAQLEAAYLQAAADNIDRYRQMSHELYNRDIPYVLLMHLGAFDARMLPRLLELYKARGFTFITLPEAERDSFYAEDTNLALPPAPDSLEGRLAASKLPFPASKPLPINLDTICR